MSGRPTLVIVGGGFSGAGVAFHLARARVDAEIVIVEPRVRLGGGLAYGGDDPVHRVNVPASRMSLFPDDEAHFSRWLQGCGALDGDPQAWVGGEAFPRRREFGRYVEATLAPFVASGAVRHIRDRVASLAKQDGLWRLRTLGGATLDADLAVIAATHPESALPRELAALSGDPRLLANPLADGVVDAVGADERVLVVGAGLTAADLVAGLAKRGHRGPITMISRRGLRSRGHANAPYPAEGDFVSAPSHEATALLARVRAAVATAEREGRSWHSVFDALRAQGGEIWRGLAPDARRRVARHLRPFWDAHRFRIAPQIDAVLTEKLADGSLVLRKARLGAVTQEGDALAIELRVRRDETLRLDFDRILVATGPAHGAVLESQAFLRELGRAGALALDETGLGLKTSLEARAIGAGGQADPTLFIAGPLARGTFGELMGLPQVSRYALFVAERVAAALTACQGRA